MQEIEEHFAKVTRSKSGRGKHLKIAYEDIRLFPTSSLLYELDKIDFSNPEEPTYDSDLEDSEESEQRKTKNLREISHSTPQQSYLSKNSERELWPRHPRIACLLSNTTLKNFQKSKLPIADIGKPTAKSVPEKDVGENSIVPPPALP